LRTPDEGGDAEGGGPADVEAVLLELDLIKRG